MTQSMSLETQIQYLRCEYLVEPRGIDEVRPRLSYLLKTDRRGARQVARRLLVSSSRAAIEAGNADVWDSGRIETAVTAQIEYAGRELRSRERLFWKVEVWDERGAMSVSPIASWTMGLLRPEDWRARWIAANGDVISRDPETKAPTLTECGTPICFRKDFMVGKGVVNATLYLSARGLIEASISGKRVSEDLFAPEWTDYDKRIQYRAYDVTELLEDGEQTIGVILGDGWWSGFVGWQETRARYGSLENSFVAQLEIEYEDGRVETISTDDEWVCDTGPLLYSDFMMGESYDARREQDGWNLPVFDANGWLSAKTVEPPRARLVAQRSEPVRITETLEARSVSEIEPGVWILDLGQNIAGWARIHISEAEGTRIQLRFAERLKPDGTLYTENLRRAKSTDTYICRGDGEEIWEPRFTFHGFQYIEVRGLSAAPKPGQILGRAINSDTPPAGRFECSSPEVNRLWLNGLWSQKDNFLSVPTDCPQRDERLGWMGDAQVFLRTASYNMDVAAFFTKWMYDVVDAQTPEGIFPDTAPRLREGENFVGLDDLVGGAGWADAGVIIPHTIWRVYGDTRIVDTHWDAMVAWLEYLERTNPDYVRIHDLRNNYGDWLCIPSDREFRTHSPMKNLLATTFWADDAAKLADMARATGRTDAAKRFQSVFEKVRAAFQKEFVREDGSLTVETQTAYLLALEMKLLPDELRRSAAERLVENIRKLDWHLSTGFIGIRFLNPVLTELGYSDVAYRLLLQDTYPSWLYPVKHGATTIWERWNGWTKDGGFFDPLMNSFNHYSLGSVGEWLFRHVGGIELDAGSPGFQRFTLCPHLGDGITRSEAAYRSINGEILSSWRLEGDRFIWDVTIPANTFARIQFPTLDDSAIVRTEDGSIEATEGLSRVGSADGRIVVEAVAGSYTFSIACRETKIPQSVCLTA